MKAKFFGVDFNVSFPAVAFLTLAVICDRQKTVLVCVLSSFFHELGHFWAMKINGVKIKSVDFNLGDVAINADLSALSYKSELFVNAGGVAVNFILAISGLLLYEACEVDFFKNLFLSNLLLAIFNVLPVRYLDGGQIFLILLQKHLTPKVAERIINILTVCFIVPVGVLGFVFLFNSSFNFSLLFAVLYLIYTLISKEFKDVS